MYNVGDKVILAHIDRTHTNELHQFLGQEFEVIQIGVYPDNKINQMIQVYLLYGLENWWFTEKALEPVNNISFEDNDIIELLAGD